MARGNISINLDPVSVSKTVQSFRQFDRRVQDRAWNAMLETGFMIERDAKGNLNHQTTSAAYGRLASSIRTNYRKAELWVENWSDVEYAPFVEFGTGTMVSIPPGYETFAAQFRRGPGVNRPAKPYLIPAFEYHSERLVRALDNIIERETRR